MSYERALSTMKLAWEFAQAPELIYLNHAAVAPWPRRTQEAVNRFAEENLRLGASRYGQWLATESTLKRQLATLLHAPSADDIALLKNTSEGLSIIAYGLPWQTGDNIVISAEEFPSNRIVWESLRGRGVEVRAVVIDGDNPEDALINAMDSNTRLLSISSVQYGSGRVLQLEKIGAACRQRNTLFCVDGIQSIGALRLDVQAIGADFVVADGHKWLLGPEGLALFYIHPNARDRLNLQQYGWHMIENHSDYDTQTWQVAKSARRFECGSPNMLGIHALSASVSLLLDAGMANIEQEVLENAHALLTMLAGNSKLTLLTPRQRGRFAGIVTFKTHDIDPQVLLQHLKEHHIICAYRGGGIRFSPHFYTSKDKLERAVRVVNEYVRD